MCGIHGQIRGFSKDRFTDIRETIHHRGPNSNDVWMDDDVLFQFVRLSILDVRIEGNQPYYKDPNHVLIFNGEIYNYQDLRKDLENDFHFTTTSDTEVLYYGLIKYGIDFLHSLNGMFGFSYYNRKTNKVYIVRDRYGIKPIFYYHDNKTFVFSSEQKSIFKVVKPELNNTMLHEHFSFKFNAGSKTLIKNLKELLPGHYLTYDLGANKISTTKWYSLPSERTNNTKHLLDEVEDLLTSSVQYRMFSDVPLGIQLSGGVDSSVISKIACEHTPYKLNSYSIGFPGYSFNEESYALNISKILGTNHHAIDFTIDDFLDDWEFATYHNDEPINHPHSLPILKLTRVAKEKVTVLLSGEGADEVFLGYEQYLAKLSLTKQKEVIDYTRFNDGKSISNMLNGDLISDNNLYNERFSLFYDSSIDKNGINVFEFKTHLITLLNRIDKMSMANSIEIRTPFLDYRMVEKGFLEMKSNLIGDQYRKKPLMNMYENYFKDGLSSRNKIGFRVPYDEWLLNPTFANRVIEYIDNLNSNPIFNKGYIQNTIKDIQKQNINSSTARESWVLANFAIWQEHFLK